MKFLQIIGFALANLSLFGNVSPHSFSITDSCCNEQEVIDPVIEIFEPIDQDLLTEIERLRFKIYQHDDTYIRFERMPDGIWLDASDGEGIHMVMRSTEGAIIATGCLNIYPSFIETTDIEPWIDAGPLTDPYVILSHHTALITQPFSSEEFSDGGQSIIEI